MPLSSHFQKENLEVSQSSNGTKLMLEKKCFLCREEVLSFLTIYLLGAKTGKGLLHVSLLCGAKREAAKLWPCLVPWHPAGWIFSGAFGRG